MEKLIISYYCIFIIFLFFIGMIGLFIIRKNLIVILMCIEIMLLAVNINFLITGSFLDDLLGQLFSLFILTIAAAESAIGLAILVIFYRIKGTVGTIFITTLKG